MPPPDSQWQRGDRTGRPESSLALTYINGSTLKIGSRGRVGSPRDRRPNPLGHLIADQIAIAVGLFLRGQDRYQKLGAGLFLAPQQADCAFRSIVITDSVPS